MTHCLSRDELERLLNDQVDMAETARAALHIEKLRGVPRCPRSNHGRHRWREYALGAWRSRIGSAPGRPAQSDRPADRLRSRLMPRCRAASTYPGAC